MRTVSRTTIPGTLPGLNEYTRANRSGKYAGAELKKDAELIVWAGIAASRPAKMKGRVHVHFAWYEKDHRRDPDNIRAGAKFILDGLVRAGVIEGDSQRFIEGLSDIYHVDKANPHIEVVIVGMGG